MSATYDPFTAEGGLSPEYLAECERLAAKHHRDHPPPYSTLYIFERVHDALRASVLQLLGRSEGRPARRPHRARIRGSRGDPEPPDLAHRCDRAIIVAVHRRERAGRYEFKIPPGALA